MALNATEEVSRIDAAIEAMQDLRSTIQDAETGQRGYLLSRKSSYLEPYEEAIATIERRRDTTRKMADAGLLPRAQVDQLGGLIDRKINELRRTVSLAQSGNVPAALEIVRGDEGQKTMEAIRGVIGEIVSAQENSRGAAAQKAVWAIQLRGAVFLAAVIISLSFLWWAYRRIGKEMMQHFVSNLETRRQKEILAVTLASIGDAVIITDVRGRITFLNEVAEKLTGWTAKEAEDRVCAEVFQIVSEETDFRWKVRWTKSGERAIAGLANHTLLIRRDGTRIPIDDSGAPIRESDGTIRGVVLIFRDFTGHKEFERTLIRAKEEIEASSKAKDKFLAMLSHELRTPLTPVLGTLSAWEAANDLPIHLRPDLQHASQRRTGSASHRRPPGSDKNRKRKLSLEKEFLTCTPLQSAVALFRDGLTRKDCGFNASSRRLAPASGGSGTTSRSF